MLQFILGGMKSGKSLYAEQQVLEVSQSMDAPDIAYLATSRIYDQEMQARVAAHKARRPDNWALYEAPLHLAETLESLNQRNQVVLVECLSMWVTNWLCDEAFSEPDFLNAQATLLDVLAGFKGKLIVVSVESGMGVVPADQLSRQYIDVMGSLHQKIASISDQATWVVAGLPIEMKKPKK